jgi:hypothetical protein
MNIFALKTFLKPSLPRCAACMLLPLVATTASSGCLIAQEVEASDHNGVVLPMDDSVSRAVAVAIGGGKILAVGGKDDVLRLKGEGTRLVDFAGKTMLPGFVDALCSSDQGLQRMPADIREGEIRGPYRC